jgi:hypothetical protein
MKRGMVKTLCLIMLPCAFIYIWIASIAIVGERDTSDSSRMRIVPAPHDLSDIYSISATVCIPSALLSLLFLLSLLSPFLTSVPCPLSSQLLSGGSLRLRDEINGRVALVVNVASL